MQKLMICMALSLLMLVSGCSTNKQVERPIVQANLLQKSETNPENLNKLSGTDGVAMSTSLEYWRNAYFECAIPRNGLIDVVIRQQSGK